MAVVDGKYDIVPGMAQTIKARMTQLKINDVASLARSTGLARQILDHLLAGYRKSYRGATTSRFCEAMQWEPDGVELLLAGRKPTPLKRSSSPVDPTLESIAQQLIDLTKRVEELEAARRKGSVRVRRAAPGSR